jgi:hypothetical protein
LLTQLLLVLVVQEGRQQVVELELMDQAQYLPE